MGRALGAAEVTLPPPETRAREGATGAPGRERGRVSVIIRDDAVAIAVDSPGVSSPPPAKAIEG